MQTLAIYGGTFDPIHNGHLYAAHSVQNFFNLDRTLFIPCKQSLLKKPTQATTEQRVAMLNLALIDYPNFQIDLREIERQSESFMVDTLKSLRQEYQQCSLSLIIGDDLLANLDKWYQWQDLLKYAHLIVVNRVSKLTLNDKLQQFINNFCSDDAKLIHNTTAGTLYFLPLPVCNISSRHIRNLISQQGDISDLVPATVKNYIIHHRLYQN